MSVSLYIHIPWCVRKCPYCDFNSHQRQEVLQEQDYIQALLSDLQRDLHSYPVQSIGSIFIGGGTPSLFTAHSIDSLLNGIAKQVHLEDGIEITLEANPGTFEQQKFKDYKLAGINRLSIGIQSFNDKHLQALGRIHNSLEAKTIAQSVTAAGFDNFNLDLMYGLPNQTETECLDDLKQAIALAPNHLSWYQLTLEPNTVFYKNPPKLPNSDSLADWEPHGYQLLSEAGYARYEVSAFAKKDFKCQHNLNYWHYGDYLGIGAGAHGKLTHNNSIIRTQKIRQPNGYLAAIESGQFSSNTFTVPHNEVLFEFMLNRLRVFSAIQFEEVTRHTGVSKADITHSLQPLIYKQLIETTADSFQLTHLGQRFVNTVLMHWID